LTWRRKRNEKAEQAKRYMYRRRWRVEAAEAETAEVETAEVETTKAETTETAEVETAEAETAEAETTEAETAHVPRKSNTPPSCWAPSSQQEPKKDTWGNHTPRDQEQEKKRPKIRDQIIKKNTICKVKTKTTRPSPAAPVKTFLFALTSGRAKRSTRSDSQKLQNQRSSQILPRSALLPDPSAISALPISFWFTTPASHRDPVVVRFGVYDFGVSSALGAGLVPFRRSFVPFGAAWTRRWWCRHKPGARCSALDARRSMLGDDTAFDKSSMISV
jgi:hypothetical protein